MTVKQALRKSYKHWLENWECSLTGEGGYYTGSLSCSLCVYAMRNNHDNRCESCILKEYGFDCTQPESPYLKSDRDKPETVGNMATLLLLVYLSECETDTEGGI